MPKDGHQPKPYQPGRWNQILQGLRYGGGVGQWSWLLHRISGLGILVFLVIHIIDTFLVVAYPATYDHTLSLYGGKVTMFGGAIDGYYWSLRWAFRFAELGLIATVLFHSINGVRVTLFDFWQGAARYQRQIFWVVLVLFFGIMIPVSYVVFHPLTQEPEHWNMIEPRPGPQEDGDSPIASAVTVEPNTLQ